MIWEDFRKAIQLRVGEGLRATIQMNGEVYPVLIEQGKKEVFTLATKSIGGLVNEGLELNPEELKDKISEFLERRDLKIGVVGPYPDGNIDFLPLGEEGVMLDKGVVPGLIQSSFPSVTRIFALVDGDNDISLAAHPDVFPITFANGSDGVKTVVRQKGGIVIERVGYEGGCAEALRIIRSHFMGIGTAPF